MKKKIAFKQSNNGNLVINTDRMCHGNCRKDWYQNSDHGKRSMGAINILVKALFMLLYELLYGLYFVCIC